MELKLKFHPLFIIFGFFLIFFGLFKLFLTYFLVLILHELGHYLTAKYLGYKLNKIVFMPYGVSLNGQGNIFTPKDEILISMAGPLVNFLLSLICVSLWWLFPISYFYTEDFVVSNMCLGIFNLVPIFPLDGGRLIVAIANSKFKKNKAIKTMKFFSIIGSFMFMALFLISVFSTINISLLFISTFLLSSALDGKNDNVYDRMYRFLKHKGTKPLEVKTFVVNQKASVYEMAKLVSGNYYIKLEVVDDDMNIIKKLTEKDIINLIDKF